MDFLNIRKKAQERARARAAAEAEARERRPPEDAPPDAPLVTEEDVLQGALAARLQGLPPAEAPPPEAAADPRFTTWRPGTGAPPPVEPEPPAEPLARPEDFAVVAPWSGGLVAAPLAPPSPWTAPPPPVSEAPPAPADPLDEFFYREDEAGPAVPELATSAPEPDATPAVERREEYLTFLLGPDEYAVAIERVREVVRPPPLAEVPRAPPHILGVVTVRGEVVAVVDPRRRLGLVPGLPPPREAGPGRGLVPAQPGEGEGKIVIVDAGEGPVGLHVDRVVSVVRLRAGSVEPCPQGIAGSRGEFLAGIGREGDRLFTILDLAALLRRGPARPEPAGRGADA